jgi:hypothetical protein
VSATDSRGPVTVGFGMTSNRQALRCKARRSADGEPCEAYAVTGAKVCSAHGGRAPQVKEAARRRSLERQAAAELARLDVTPLEDPLSELALLAAQIVAWKNMMAERVNALTSLRYEGEGSGEQLRAEVALWERALDRCERVLTAMARLNIDERLTEISEIRAHQIISFLTAVLARFGIPDDEHALAAIEGMFAEARGRDDGLPGRREIEAPRWPQLSPVCEMGEHGRCRSYVPVPDMPDPPPWPERCPCDCHDPAGNGGRLQLVGAEHPVAAGLDVVEHPGGVALVARLHRAAGDVTGYPLELVHVVQVLQDASAAARLGDAAVDPAAGLVRIALGAGVAGRAARVVVADGRRRRLRCGHPFSLGRPRCHPGDRRPW